MSSKENHAEDPKKEEIGRVIELLQESLRIDGYLSRESLLDAAEKAGRSPAEIYGFATFYDQFGFEKPGRHRIRVCLGTACHLKGGSILMDEWRRRLGIDAGQTTSDGEFSLERVACVGCCSLAPVLLDGDEVHGHAQVSTIGGMMLKAELERKAEAGGEAAADRKSGSTPALREKAEKKAEKEEAGLVTRARFEGAVARAEACYSELWTSETPTVMVGNATCGRAAGSRGVLEAFADEARILGVSIRLVEAGCLGHCYAEPMAIIRRPEEAPVVFGHLTERTARLLVSEYIKNGEPLWDVLLGSLEPDDRCPAMEDLPRFGLEERRLLRRCGRTDPTDLDHYLATSGYSGLVRALDLSPDEVIEQVRASGLRGLGGAGFPLWRKWLACQKQPSQIKYIICNADEGDPGAFMDRTMLESDPFSVLEGMTIAGYAIGARTGIVFVRSEYPLAALRVTEAIKRCRSAGLLGPNLLGSSFSFDVNVVPSAGAFVCGESTALMASLEGRRGYPRIRPPRSVEAGLFMRPTALNNVKSFAAVSLVFEKGATYYKGIGTERSKGTAVFALAGKVNNVGLVEVPMGATLRQVVFDIGGGVPRGRLFKAVQIGGPSGGCLDESMLDTEVDFDSLGEAGAMMGSGGLVVLDEDDCMVETARYFMEFLAKESCGKCVFCREGTAQMLGILERIVRGDGVSADLERLTSLARSVTAGSLCNLGKTAAACVRTTLSSFGDEYEAHVGQKRCPAGVCRDLIRFEIDPGMCARGCEVCVGACPTEAIHTDERTRVKTIDQKKCVKCRSCLVVCPPQYDAVLVISPSDSTPPWRGVQARDAGDGGQ